MIPATLTKDLIDNTSAMRLILRVAPERMDALILGPEGPEQTVLAHSVVPANDSAKALEDAIYDNPLLLGDFDSTDIILTSREFFSMPPAAAELRETMAEIMLPDYDAERTLLDDSARGAGLCYAVEADKLNFLRRTFACARFRHSLAIDAEALEAPGLYALCDDDASMNLVRIDGEGAMTYLNRPQTYSPADCAYYILATVQSGDEIFLSAPADINEQICSLIDRVNSSARVLPLTLDEPGVKLRDRAPGAPLDMIFLTRQ